MVDRQAVEKQWAARGYSCDLWVDPPGQCWENFAHPVDELLMPVEGRLEVEIAGELHRPETGCELHIPADARHSVRNIGGVTARWLYGYRRV